MERGFSSGAVGRGILNRNQKAAARQLSLAAYLLSSEGKAKDEVSIREALPPYEEVYAASLGEDENRDRAGYALRKQLARDVAALADAGVRVEGEPELAWSSRKRFACRRLKS